MIFTGTMMVVITVLSDNSDNMVAVIIFAGTRVLAIVFAGDMVVIDHRKY